MNIINRINELMGQIQINDMKITNSGGVTCFYGTESREELVEHVNEALSYAIDQGRDSVAGYN